MTISTYAFEIEPKLDCGDYQVTGKLLQAKKGKFYLNIRDKSASPFELILIGGTTKEKLLRHGTIVTAEVHVPKKIEHNQSPYVYLKKFLPHKVVEYVRANQDPILLNKKTCVK